MLKLVNIKKDYVIKGQESVHALKGVTLNFRRNEFVAILGPSGCGKTTLLNITGGLDRYTSGDLIIEGKSTKNYSDYDWDTYRNHSIGFIFQAYNLIQHQNILKNVELALTISGVSKKERYIRAVEALDKVGLKGLYKKKPNQLSGGQMQRVAIARSLVNNPEILLADEPTGALDSETSIQIMDLLKEVAKDRLVIMVTHNPDLAYKYATRIVKMSDGVITDDSSPYLGESKEELTKALEDKKEKNIVKGKKKKTSMSFITATGLSGANLISKLRRTILVTIAGSIGIIGVASVLAVSNGISSYIDSMQEDMLSSYPLSIAEESMDYSSLISGLSNWEKAEIAKFDLTTQVGVDSMISYLMEKYQDVSQIKTNDINQDLMDFISEIPSSNLSSVNYNYAIDPSNNIFTSWKRHGNSDPVNISVNGITNKYINSLKTVDGFSQYAQYVSLFSNFMKQLTGEKDYILSQYDLLAGEFPTKKDEMILVVDNNQTLTDILLGQLGFYDQDQWINIALYAIEKTKENPDPAKLEKYKYETKFDFDKLLNKEFVYYPHDSIWSTGLTYETDAYIHLDFINPDDTFALIYDANTDTLTKSYINISDFTIKSSVNYKRSNKEDYDPKLEFPMQGNWKQDGGSANTIKVVKEDNTVKAFLNGVETSLMSRTLQQSFDGYYYNSQEQSTWQKTGSFPMKITGILKPKTSTNFGSLSRGIYYTKEFTKQFMDDALNSNIVKSFEETINDPNGKGNEQICYAYLTSKYSSYAIDEDHTFENLTGISFALNTDMASSLSSMISSSGVNYLELNKGFLRGLSGLASKEIEQSSLFDFKQFPKSISIYPKNFDKKAEVRKYLDKWNSDEDLIIKGRTVTRENRRDLTYNDAIEIIITVINTLILAITIALVSFTSLALVVSCFMIAVITYISTMERVKEIGVIRSLGGRKKDVSRLFIAECLITGLASGIFGVIITLGICAIINVSVISLVHFNIASLTIWVALIMIGLSALLNVLSGLIPSMKASKQDPVIALRSE